MNDRLTDKQITRLAKSAYAAYGAVTHHKNYQGLPMPDWEMLTPTIQEAWKAASLFAYRQGILSTGQSDVPDHR